MASPQTSTSQEAISRAPSGMTTKPSSRARSTITKHACDTCRRRKLKCDGEAPTCSSCVRIGTQCQYVMSRGKSGPRKGHLKALYDRLANMERVTKAAQTMKSANGAETEHDTAIAETSNIDRLSPNDVSSITPETAKTLDQVFFKNAYIFAPVLHEPSLMASLGSLKPPLEGLRHAMWALAAGHHNGFLHLQDQFYRSARKSLQQDEISDEGALTLSHCQAWLLINVYEFKFLKMSRAWLSTGNAIRIAQAIGIDRLEGISSGALARSPASADLTVTELEVRRRTFWMVFWADRCCSMGSGWPFAIDEINVTTGLPDFEDAFQNGYMKSTPRFDDVLNARTRQFSPLAAAITVLGLHGRTLGHLQRPLPVQERNDFGSDFWGRHREIDELHSRFSLNMPSHLRISPVRLDPTIVYAHLAFHSSVICLQQSAVLHASEAQPYAPPDFIEQCRLKSLSAATEIASIMRTSSNMDMKTLSYFASWPLYVASRVLIQHLQFYGDEDDVAASLNFLVTALQAFVRSTRNAFTYLIQLLDDIESSGVLDLEPFTEARAEALEHQRSANPHPEKLTNPMTRFMTDTPGSTASLEGHSTISHAIAHNGFQSLLSPGPSPDAGGIAQDNGERSGGQTLPGLTWQDTNFDATDFLSSTTDLSTLFLDGNVDPSTDAAMDSWSFPSMGQLPLDWDFTAPIFDNPPSNDRAR